MDAFTHDAPAVSMRDIVEAIQPLDGHVVPIKSIQEVNPPEGYDDAYVAEVDIKSASRVIKALDAAFPRDSSLPLNHLRRFCKRDKLPESVKQFVDEAYPQKSSMAPSIFILLGISLPDLEAVRTLLEPFIPVPRARSSSPQEPQETSTPSSPEQSPELTLFRTKIPIYPPASAKVADMWSASLWPVTFNPAASRSTVAPNPQTLNRDQKSIEPRAGYYVSLAREVALEAKQSGRGRGVGAVIVDPRIEAQIDEKAWEEGYNSRERWPQAVVAVAGDCRFARSEAGGPSQMDRHPGIAPNPACETYNSDHEGGPDLHALMRAVELVARSRREDPENEVDLAAMACQPIVHTDPQLSKPNQLSAFERYFLYEAGSHVIDDDSTSYRPSPATSCQVSPRKRKFAQPNPEAAPITLDTLTEVELPPSTTTTPPLPAPPASDPASLPPAPQEPIEESGGRLPTSRIRSRAEGGYLCTSLDVYLSHEPCICCCMGLLLSRFRAVIYPRAGRLKSGGLASGPVETQNAVLANGDVDADASQLREDREYYGLHWRKELNWRALGFEFVEDVVDENFPPEQIAFHA
ncbi:unnamed protein product [Penicillium pancosmium]